MVLLGTTSTRTMRRSTIASRSPLKGRVSVAGSIVRSSRALGAGGDDALRPDCGSPPHEAAAIATAAASARRHTQRPVRMRNLRPEYSRRENRACPRAFRPGPNDYAGMNFSATPLLQ
jgi:hypothetical protein